MAKSNRTKLIDLVDHFEPVLRQAFLDAIADIVSGADLGRIVKALERGDIEGALRAVHLDPASFSKVDIALAQAYQSGGVHTVSNMPLFRDAEDNRVIVRFDARNPRAEAWLSYHSSELITNIVDDQRNAIRTALTQGMAAGQGPRDVALDIVGRIDPATGNRTGGVIGLTSQQEEFSRNFRAELESGDPAKMRNIFTRTLRDKRFDARIQQAIADGKAVDAATVDKLVIRYRASLLRMRGEAVGRTEALGSLHAAQDEAYQQAVEKGAVNREAISKVWNGTRDHRERHTHLAMEGQKVPLDGTFKSPSGAKLRYPGDPLAPAAEIIHCRCGCDYVVNFLAGVL